MRIAPILFAVVLWANVASAGGTVITQPVGQQRVTGTCSSPNGIITIAANGSVTCATGVGDVDGVTAGAGLINGGTTGTVTLDVGAGTAITVNANDIAVSTNGITDALLRQSSGLSVIGRSANSMGNVADIVAGADGDVLRRSGTSLGFGTVVTAGIADDAITFAKFQNLTSDRLLGRDTASSGDVEELTVSGGLEFTGSGGIQRSALTGDVTASAGSGSTTIPNDTVTYAKLQNVSATSRFLGRITTGAGDVEELTGTQATTLLDAVTTSAKGVVPTAPNDTTKFLRGDATWAVPTYSSLSGAFTTSNVIPKGNGTGLTSSSLSDPGTGIVTDSTTGQTNFRLIGDSDASGDSAYTGFILARGSTPTELWYIGRDGTGNTDGLIFRRSGTTNDLKIDTSGNATFAGAVTVTSTSALNGTVTLNRSAGVAPIVSWKQSGQAEWQLYQLGSSDPFRFWNSTLGSDACSITTAGLLNCVGGLTENGAAVLSGAISSNAVPKGSSSNLVDGMMVDTGTTVTATASDGGSHAGRPAIIVTNSNTGGAFDHRAALQLISANAAGVNQTSQVQTEGAALFISAGGGSGALTLQSGSTTNNGTFSIRSGNSLSLNNSANSASGSIDYGNLVAGNGFRFVAGSTRAAVVSDGRVFYGDTTETAVDNNIDVVTIGDSGTGQTTTGKALINATKSGTYDTTAGGIVAQGATISVTATESAGGNALQNRALSLSASGADQNTALQTNDGDVLLNNASGTTTIKGTTTIDDNATVTGTLGVTGLLTATAGGTTPANWTTTGTGDLVSADDLTVADDATVTDTLTVQGSSQFGNNAAADFVGINISPDSNHQLTFAEALGNKIALYPADSTNAYGFGVQSGQLQIYAPSLTSTWISVGAGDSDSFAESQRFDTDGQVWFGDNAGKTAVENNLDVVTIGNTGTGQTTSATKLLNVDGSTQGWTTSAGNNKYGYGAYISMGNGDDACSQCSQGAGGFVGKVGLYVEAGSADSYMAAVFGNGAVYSADAIVIGGGMPVLALGDVPVDTDDGDEGIYISPSATAFAGDYYGLNIDTGNTLDGTAAARNQYNIYSVADATRSGGSNPVTNYGIYATASGAQVNYSGYFDAGTFQVNGSAINFGNSATDLATFSNGPAGINTYDGTHLEWSDEWLYQTFTNANILGIYYVSVTSGTVSANVTGVGRPGIAQISTSNSGTGNVVIATNLSGFDFGQYTASVYEWIGGFPTLSTSSEEYTGLVGFFDTANAVNQTDGCYFLYDRVGTSTDPGTGDATGTPGDFWQIWCASNGTRTGYILNTTTNAQDSFPRVVSAVAATTWPSTNTDHLEIVMEGTSKAHFWIDGVEVGRITTNIPSGTSRLHGAGFALRKSNGTTARTMDTDYTKLALDMSAARSP